MRYIKLTQGNIAIVDDSDYNYLNQFKWQMNASGYAVRGSSRKLGPQRQVFMHRCIIPAPLNMDVDHINHNKLDNQTANLRVATRSENLQNQKPRGGSSQYKGVCWCITYNKWVVRITVNKQKKFLGYFHDEVFAAKMYDRAARKHFGEFALCNFEVKPKPPRDCDDDGCTQCGDCRD